MISDYFDNLLQENWGRRGHDRMVVRFIATCASSARHH